MEIGVTRRKENEEQLKKALTENVVEQVIRSVLNPVWIVNN